MVEVQALIMFLKPEYRKQTHWCVCEAFGPNATRRMDDNIDFILFRT